MHMKQSINYHNKKTKNHYNLSNCWLLVLAFCNNSGSLAKSWPYDGISVWIVSIYWGQHCSMILSIISTDVDAPGLAHNNVANVLSQDIITSVPNCKAPPCCKSGLIICTRYHASRNSRSLASAQGIYSRNASIRSWGLWSTCPIK